MKFAEIEAEYRKLKAQYDAGTFSEADFKARLQDLMIEDEQGRWWIIGYETGQWYVSEGEQWVPGEPPETRQVAPVLAEPSQPAPLAPRAQVKMAPEMPNIQPPAGPQAGPAAQRDKNRPWLWIAAGIVGVVILALLLSRPGSSDIKRTPRPTATPTQFAKPILTPTQMLPAFSVTSVRLRANPPSFTGACPATFAFMAGITTSAPGAVAYRWERSDGASGPVTTIVFGAAESLMIDTTWTLGVSGTRWIRVHVLSPNEMLSDEAPFTLACVTAAETAPPTPLALSQNSFRFTDFPYDTANRDITVYTTGGRKVGAIYFYEWKGQAYNVGANMTIRPDISIAVRGLTDLRNSAAAEQTSALDFAAGDMSPGTKRSTRAGGLFFTATIIDARIQMSDGKPYWVSENGVNGLTVVVDVAIAP